LGRPSKFDPAICEQTVKLCKLGATDKELADFFGVSEQTVGNWKVQHPEFLGAIKAGKEEADACVADRLFARATGYSHPEVHVSNYQGVITLTPITKHYPPDSVAAIFWLKNRQPSNWRDIKAVELSNAGGKPFSLQLLSSDARL
jgi:hypothetical protein